MAGDTSCNMACNTQSINTRFCCGLCPCTAHGTCVYAIQRVGCGKHGHRQELHSNLANTNHMVHDPLQPETTRESTTARAQSPAATLSYPQPLILPQALPLLTPLAAPTPIGDVGRGRGRGEVAGCLARVIQPACAIVRGPCEQHNQQFVWSISGAACAHCGCSEWTQKQATGLRRFYTTRMADLFTKQSLKVRRGRHC